jgi:hypothetical protein
MSPLSSRSAVTRATRSFWSRILSTTSATCSLTARISITPLSGRVSSFSLLPHACHLTDQSFAAMHCYDRHLLSYFYNYINTLTTDELTACCHPLLKHEPEDSLPDVCFENIPCDPSSTTTSYSQPPPTTYPHTHTHTHTKPPGNPASSPTDPPYNPPSTTTTSYYTKSTSKSGGGGGGGGGDWHGPAYGTYFYQNGQAGCVLVQRNLAVHGPYRPVLLYSSVRVVKYTAITT